MTRYKHVRGALEEHNLVFNTIDGHHHDGYDSRLIAPQSYVTGYIDVAYNPTQVLNTGSTFALSKTIYYNPTGSGLYSFYPYPYISGSKSGSQGDYGFLVRGDVQLVRVTGFYMKNAFITIPGGYYVLAENDTEVIESGSAFTVDKSLYIGQSITGSQTIQVWAEFRDVFVQPYTGVFGQWQIFLDNVLLWSGSMTQANYVGAFVGLPTDVVISPTSVLTLKMKGVTVKDMSGKGSKDGVRLANDGSLEGNVRQYIEH